MLPYRPVLVFGATGQQGGSVAAELLRCGVPVRALVRNPDASKSWAIMAAGAELVRVDIADAASIRSDMAGAGGVFSVQPSSEQGALYVVTDEDPLEFGVHRKVWHDEGGAIASMAYLVSFPSDIAACGPLREERMHARVTLT